MAGRRWLPSSDCVWGSMGRRGRQCGLPRSTSAANSTGGRGAVEWEGAVPWDMADSRWPVADDRWQMAFGPWALGLERVDFQRLATLRLMGAGDNTTIYLGAFPPRLVPSSNPRRFAVSPPRAGRGGAGRGRAERWGARGARRRDPTRGRKCPRQTHAKEWGGRRGSSDPEVRQSGSQEVRRSGGQAVRRSGSEEGVAYSERL
jgi:hypothetical protein